ncbi:MAG: DUF1080 domain-containing protein [Pirellulales bacterium]
MLQRFLICAVLGSVAASGFSAEPNTLTPDEMAKGWILLFDGESTFGWKAATDANWNVADGAITVSEGTKGLLNTTSQFADYVFKADFRASAETNSGIFLRTPPIPTDPAKDCYELNIAAPAISPFPTGSFVGRQRSGGQHDLTQWHSYEVAAQGAQITVKLDGETVLDYTDPHPLARGHIGLQYNAGPVEFRNIKLKPLGLRSIFNGKDLSGWKELAGKASVYSVTSEGYLHVENGDGQLESEESYGDFVLQLEAISHGEHLNSGIFFRSIPGDFKLGYEFQIQNGYKDGDRNKPLDCGTGGFYRRQDARRVVSNDHEWFAMTLVADGPHMAGWVNGFPVSDWTDTRKPDANPRKGLRVEAGTLSIQGHDPTTNLSFRNLRIVELAK